MSYGTSLTFNLMADQVKVVCNKVQYVIFEYRCLHLNTTDKKYLEKTDHIFINKEK